MKKIINLIFNILGYEIRKKDSVEISDGFEIYQYRNSDGSFDYKKYRKTQIDGNKRKINNVWVLEKNIKFLADYLDKNIKNISFGLCHGTRRGKEQEWFKKYLKCDVLGTEISDTAVQFPDTIQWDFHDVKPEWLESADFIYSNSLDHSYDPKSCLKAWLSCLKKEGVCIIEHSSAHERATKLDPFGADISVMPYLILSWADGDFCVRELITAPEKELYDAPVEPGSIKYIQYLIIQRL